MKHTPAPWRVTHISTHEAPNNHVHTFEVYTDTGNDHNNAIGLANADLISKAPEMRIGRVRHVVAPYLNLR